MTDDRLDPQLQALLSDRAGALSSDVLRAVDAEVRQTPQAGTTAFERRTRFPRPRWELAAAATVAILVLGVAAIAEIAPGLFGPEPPDAGTSASSSAAPVASSLTGSLAGLWSTVDVDGSVMTVTMLRAGERWDVTSVDTRASACGGGPLVSHGTAPVADGRIEAEMVGGCVGLPTPGGATPSIWTYDTATDTLRTEATVGGAPIEFTWRRGADVADAFSRTWVLDAGGETRSLRLSGSGLSREVSYLDSGSSRCGGQPFQAAGSGTIGSQIGEGRLLRTALAGGCPGASSGFDWTFEYHVESDTLVGPLDASGGSLPETGSWHS